MGPQDLTPLADLDYAQVEHQDLFLFKNINFLTYSLLKFIMYIAN